LKSILAVGWVWLDMDPLQPTDPTDPTDQRPANKISKNEKKWVSTFYH
jgi:hypothetical protein